MNVHDKMHPAQVEILHCLLFRPSASFGQLQKASQLSSDHFNFHLKKMLEQGVVHKNAASGYELTKSGKEYANRFDTDERVVERQPKVAVLLLVRGENGRMLYQQRLKQPFYGFWGRPTGKLRWGETIIEGAARELMEETGLRADLEVKKVYHKQDFSKETGEILEDKIFFVVLCTNPVGNLIEKFDGGRNAWLTYAEVEAEEKVFGGLKEGHDINSASALCLTEKAHYYSIKDY